MGKRRGDVIVDFDVKIPKRAEGDAVRIGALTWPYDLIENGRSTVQILDDIASLDTTRKAPTADIVLFTGIKVSETAECDLDQFAQKVAKSFGCPVLFESPNLSRGKAWYLGLQKAIPRKKSSKRKLHKKRYKLLVRTGQYVFDNGGTSSCDDMKVLSELHAGYGTFHFHRDGHPIEPALALILCGEVRIFQTKSAKGRVLENHHASVFAKVPDVLRKNWVMLHPSHSPYFPRRKDRGYGIIGPIGKQPPQLSRLVAERDTDQHDALPPCSVVHVGPYARTPGAVTAQNELDALLCFRRGRTKAERPSVSSTADGLRYAEFEV